MSFFGEDALRFAARIEQLAGQPIAILGHLRPDADCIGSQVALCRQLLARGEKAVCVNQHPIPRALREMVADTPFTLASNFQAEGWTAVTVDCADRIRIGEMLQRSFPEIAYNIDHHISNTAYGQENLIVANAAATGEILAGLFFDLGWPVDAVSAQALYTAIATDTGMFRYENTRARVFDVCAQLMRCGATAARTSSWLFDNEPFGKRLLLRHFLESLKLECGGRLCYGTLPLGCFEETGTDKEDAEGFVDYARDVEGVEIGLLLEEYEPGKTKGSLRAINPEVRVDLLARQLGGGGHAAAAGFNQPLSLEAILPRVLETVATHLNGS